MGSNPEAGVVAGVFADEEHAADAVKQLIEAHYDPSVIASHRREHDNVPIWEEYRFARNASTGAVIGAVLAGLGVFMAGLPVGPFTMIAAGPLMAALEAAFGGGCLGFALGALLSLDLSKEEAVFHRTHIHDGVVWVGVQAEGARGVRARQILATAGARHFTS